MSHIRLILLFAFSSSKWMAYFSALSMCLMMIYLNSMTSIQNSDSRNVAENSISTTREMEYQKHLTEPDVNDHVKNDLLHSVNNLVFKVVTESPVVLQSVYFIPDDLMHVHYNSLFIYEPQEGCKGSEYLLILVPSHPKSIRERRAIRDTWGSVARGRAWPDREHDYHVKLLFVLGVSNTSTPTELLNIIMLNKHISQISDNSRSDIETLFETNMSEPSHLVHNDTDHLLLSNRYNSNGNRNKNKKILDLRKDGSQSYPLPTDDFDLTTEINLFDDILLIDLCDSYTNLTRKIISAFRWIAKSCTDVKYILKVDQDVFAHIPLITTFLKRYGKANTIYGHIIENAEVFREGRWAVTNTSLPISQYPIYASGNAYILSGDIITRILHLAPRFRYVPIEDAFITGILATVGGVDRVHIDGFTYWSSDRPHICEFVNNRRYVGNKYTEYDHRRTWEMLLNRGRGQCTLCMWLSWVVEADVILTGC